VILELLVIIGYNGNVFFKGAYMMRNFLFGSLVLFCVSCGDNEKTPAASEHVSNTASSESYGTSFSTATNLTADVQGKTLVNVENGGFSTVSPKATEILGTISSLISLAASDSGKECSKFLSDFNKGFNISNSFKVVNAFNAAQSKEASAFEGVKLSSTSFLKANFLTQNAKLNNSFAIQFNDSPEMKINSMMEFVNSATPTIKVSGGIEGASSVVGAVTIIKNSESSMNVTLSLTHTSEAKKKTEYKYSAQLINDGTTCKVTKQ